MEEVEEEEEEEEEENNQEGEAGGGSSCAAKALGKRFEKSVCSDFTAQMYWDTDF